jgi:hypothetical protein
LCFDVLYLMFCLWYYVLKLRFDIMFRRFVSTFYFDVLFWRFVLTFCFDVLFWRFVSTFCFDVLFWHFVSTFCFDVLFRRFVCIFYSKTILAREKTTSQMSFNGKEKKLASNWKRDWKEVRFSSENFFKRTLHSLVETEMYF